MHVPDVSALPCREPAALREDVLRVEQPVAADHRVPPAVCRLVAPVESWSDPLCLLQQLLVVVQDHDLQCLHEPVPVRPVPLRVCVRATEQVDRLVLPA